MAVFKGNPLGTCGRAYSLLGNVDSCFAQCWVDVTRILEIRKSDADVKSVLFF